MKYLIPMITGLIALLNVSCAMVYAKGPDGNSSMMMVNLGGIQAAEDIQSAAVNIENYGTNNVEGFKHFTTVAGVVWATDIIAGAWKHARTYDHKDVQVASDTTLGISDNETEIAIETIKAEAGIQELEILNP